MPIAKDLAGFIRNGNGGIGSWAKLALWAQTAYRKIIYLDLDVVLLHNIDEMASFPGDTFAPEVCSLGCKELAAGLNTGTMVVQPSEERFESLVAYAETLRHRLLASSGSASARLSQRWFADSDQSFLKWYHWEVLSAAVGARNPARLGDNWTWRSFNTTRCTDLRADIQPAPQAGLPPRKACTTGTAKVMSRVYNARPQDCVRCASSSTSSSSNSSSYQPRVVHFACHPWKPWVNEGRMRNASRCRHPWACAPCVREWTLKWHDARRRMAARLSGGAGTVRRPPRVLPTLSVSNSDRQTDIQTDREGNSFATRLGRAATQFATQALASPH